MIAENEHIYGKKINTQPYRSYATIQSANGSTCSGLREAEMMQMVEMMPHHTSWEQFLTNC